MATGRSDYPNQVNNVLGFPFIFRGALDVRAKSINNEMKIAAVKSLAELAKEDVPDSVIKAYGDKPIQFGKDYIIPKPFDSRVLIWEASAVAKAAVDTGVARRPINDFDAYRDHLEGLLGKSREIMRLVINKAKKEPKKIVYPEGWEPKIMRACQIITDEQIGHPILLGTKEFINEQGKTLNVDLGGAEIIDPDKSDKLEKYAKELHRMRARKGMTYSEAKVQLKGNWRLFGAMMVKMGDADGMIAGVNYNYPDTIRPALQAIGPILMGVSKSIHVLQRNCEVNDIVNMTAIAVLDAQKNE